jgi:hypothetical protein
MAFGVIEPGTPDHVITAIRHYLGIIQADFNASKSHRPASKAGRYLPAPAAIKQLPKPATRLLLPAPEGNDNSTPSPSR